MYKRDVVIFWMRLEDNLFMLHQDLKSGMYRQGAYEQFYVHDPKRRLISKATVRDRVVHQAIEQVVLPLIEPTYIFDSYAARTGKGIHGAVMRLEGFLRQASKNYQQPAYALKCDVKRFFDSISHERLLGVIAERFPDERFLSLMGEIIGSYEVGDQKRCGLPLGNVTSQLCANWYLNAFDHFVKEKLRLRWYLRFCDDFVIVHQDAMVLASLVPVLRSWLEEKRGLILHPHKVTICKFSQGIDFVGQVLRPYVRTIRTKTRRRLVRSILLHAEEYVRGGMDEEMFRQSLQSAYGALKHGNNHSALKQLQKDVVSRLLL